MSCSFCQICRHPSPGHEADCPVLSGEPVRGMAPAGSLSERELLTQAVTVVGILTGALEELRESLLKDDPVKWHTLVRGIERVLARTEELRDNF